MQLTGCRSSPASEVPRGAGLVVIDGLPQAALLESGKPLGFLVQRPLNDIHRSPRLGDRATLVGLTSPEGSWSLDDRNRCTIDPLRSPLSNVWYMLIAVIQSRVGCGQSRPVAALRQPIANDLSTPWCHRPRRDCSTEPGYPVNPPTVTLSVAALIALGPTPGFVKKLAELLDYGRLGGPDCGRHQAEARVGECLMTWEYSIDFRKRAFVCLIVHGTGRQLLKYG